MLTVQRMINSVEADVKNGSFTQPPDFSGLSHLYEHMFFKANTSYPSPDDFVAHASELSDYAARRDALNAAGGALFDVSASRVAWTNDRCTW